MQHYGAPTRVLDWTGSPCVAVYFAVEQGPDNSGEVWCYAEDELEKLWTAAKASGQLDRWPVQLAWNAYEEVKRIDEKPILHHFIHGTRTARMAAQQGVFTVCTYVFQDHAALLKDALGPEQEKKAYRRAIIPNRLKREFLERLRFMNITGASLFPGVDEVGRFVEESARIHMCRRDCEFQNRA